MLASLYLQHDMHVLTLPQFSKYVQYYFFPGRELSLIVINIPTESFFLCVCMNITNNVI